LSPLLHPTCPLKETFHHLFFFPQPCAHLQLDSSN
jgi:hypothetical protein